MTERGLFSMCYTDSISFSLLSNHFVLTFVTKVTKEVLYQNTEYVRYNDSLIDVWIALVQFTASLEMSHSMYQMKYSPAFSPSLFFLL